MPVRRLCVDIDNVITRTDEVMRRLIRAHSRDRVDLTYEQVVCFDYHLCADSKGNKISKEEWSTVHHAFSQPEVISSLLPIDGAREGLARLAGAGFELHLVTSRLAPAHDATRDWVAAANLPPHTLHFVGHRKKHVALGEFVAAVEDDLDQARLFAEAGVPAYLVAHPWNVTADSPLLKRLPGWPEIVKELLRAERAP